MSLFIAIIGGSGSGKSWLAEKLAAKLGRRAARLSLDDFYLDRSHLPAARRAKLNFDHPRSIDWTALERAMRELRAGRPARIPGYDFATHCRRRRWRRLQPKQVILVDGLWLLNRRSLGRLFTLSVFLDVPSRTRLQRRLQRDLAARGRTRASVAQQFREFVEPMHRRYVAPQRCKADVVLHRTCTAEDAAQLADRIDRIIDGNRMKGARHLFSCKSRAPLMRD